MSEDSRANVRVSRVTLEAPAAKDLLESKEYLLSPFWKVNSDISINHDREDLNGKKGLE